MDIYTSLIEFFDINSLAQDATIIDLVNYGMSVFVAIFIVAFIIRTLFLVVALPEKNW